MADKRNNKQLVLGIMSGTSLDGIDLALCEFDQENGIYTHKIIAAKTSSYTDEWKKWLTEVKKSKAESYFKLHAAYGNLLADEVNAFLRSESQKPLLIASHGHTVFHQPDHGFSTQLGCGATIAAKTGITTVNDFRSLDVALSGQGAPLVPIGDKILFSDYQACLNIGGIANISFDKEGKRIAYDICEANMLLNLLAEKKGLAFDNGGDMARMGMFNDELLVKLDGLVYYSQKGAKSIGREWFEENVEPLLEMESDIHALLATSTEHIATIIANELNAHKIQNVLVTGGGAFNTFLIESIQSKTECQLVIPEKELVNFKEALLFAFLGYLRINQQVNTLSSVTGAKQDSVGGAVYLI